MELAEAFNDPRRLLWHYANAVVDGSLGRGRVGADGRVGGGGIVVDERVRRDEETGSE